MEQLIPMAASSGRPAAPAPRPTGEQRRRALARAAFELIAERGFEGLRTREVAARAGVNIATLHYYFPSKEDLIRGVRLYLAEQFMTVHAPGYATARTPLDRLRQEFADAKFYQTEHRAMHLVLYEIYVRAERDPALRSMLDGLEGEWHRGIEQIVRDGVREGAFCADLDPSTTAAVIMGFVRGAFVTTVAGFDFDRACALIERWLTTGPGTGPNSCADQEPTHPAG